MWPFFVGTWDARKWQWWRIRCCGPRNATQQLDIDVGPNAMPRYTDDVGHVDLDDEHMDSDDDDANV